MAQKVKSLEQLIITTYKRVKDRIISQSFMSENMPKVIDSLVVGQYDDVDSVKEETKKLLDSVHMTQQKLEIDFRPDKVVDAFLNCQKEF